MRTKPERLLLPPDFIYDKSFHESLVSLGCNLLILRNGYSNEYKLWHTVLAQIIRYRESREYSLANDRRKIDLVNDFCNSVKGLCHIYFGQDYFIEKESVLYLEGLSELPNNFLDESFIIKLKNKYTSNNYDIEFQGNLYLLLDTHDEYIGRNFVF